MLKFADEDESLKPYRIFSPHLKEDVHNPCVLFWYKRHPVQELGEGITFAKHKLSILQNAAVASGLGSNRCIDFDGISLHENGIITSIPSDLWIYDILSFLAEGDILSFSNTCKFARAICLDNVVWRMLCFRTFQDPNIFNVDFRMNSCWKRKYLLGNSIEETLSQHYWRHVFIVLYQFERTQSVVHSTALHHSRRLSECHGSSLELTVESSKGIIILKGIRQVSCVEFVVYNYDIQSWHRKAFSSIAPFEKDAIFKEFGIVMSKTRCKLGPVKRRGYFLYTDIGERIFLVNSSHACFSFRTFKFGGSHLLLCHNVTYDGAKYSDEFSLFEMKLISRE